MKFLTLLFILYASTVLGLTLNDTKKMAEQGDSKAQLDLAKQYILLSSPTDAIKWLKLSAEQNNAEAQVMLGKQYESGLLIKQNYRKALDLYSKAAENGYWDGQYNMGKMYLNGIGTLQDYVSAYAWLNEATLAGKPNIVKERDALSKMMSPNQLAKAKELSKSIHERLSNRHNAKADKSKKGK